MLTRVLLAVTLLASLGANATTLKAELKGGSWRWTNAVPFSGDASNIVPSRWNVADGLAPSQEVVLGGLMTSGVKTASLSFGGERVEFPLNVLGFEYNLGELSGRVENGEPQTGTLCSTYGSFSSQIGLTGSAMCIAPTSYKVTDGLVSANPYSFIRPIIQSIDTGSISALFSGKPPGRYIGSVPVTSFYDYYVPGSSIRTRHQSVDVITIEVDYEPSFLTQLTLSGDDELKNLYNKIENTVSGSTQYKIDAKGWFSNGLSVSLLTTRDNYEMKGPSLTTLPYSIDCIGCAEPSLVEGGTVKTSKTSVPGTDTANITFDLKVNFTDVDLDTLENGHYSDSFILFVEAGL
ncbi:hypothetical protein CGI23_24205 [Vibrio parahaemolyticus]|uniref:hypothetical protein n=1 Tax=Vibrio parahaemolyticus TaxID=670 RepID=UPI001122D66D|nr:hypothetical protein [Vibrio parahaemolyticus]TOK18359.1 hypothetical protein CGI23_24205 [Vibrio parahaemolyticus]